MIAFLRLAAVLLTTWSGPMLFGAVPTINGLFPCGIKAGSSMEVSLSGAAEPWPPNFWCSEPKIQFTPGAKSPLVTLTIPPDTRPGPHLFRAWNAEGTSEPVFFLVGDKNETVVLEDEKNKNQGLEGAQVIEAPLPLCIYGRLNPGQDVDGYQIPLKKGQTFHASLEAYPFATGMDSILHLYNSKGEQIQLAHDTGIHPDPQIIYQAIEDGTHTLVVMAIAIPPTASVSFHGGANCCYRINLALTPNQLPGRLLPEKGTPDADLSKLLTPPVDLYGTLKSPGAIDTLSFLAVAKEPYQIEAQAFRQRYPTDPVLTIKTADGKLIKEIDDAKAENPDSSYLFKAATDGLHTISIRDRYGKGGPDYRYHFTIRPPQPKYTANADKSNYVIEAGKDVSLTITLTRINDHLKPLKLAIKGLPDSVTLSEPPVIPEKSGAITIKLKAASDSKKFSGPIQIALNETDGEKPRSEMAAFEFKDASNPTPYYFERISDIWLTVKETAPPKTEPKPNPK